MSVVPMNARTAEILAVLDRPPERPPEAVVLQPAARNSYAALKGLMGQLDRILAGPSCPAAQAARIVGLTDEIRAEAARLGRFAR